LKETRHRVQNFFFFFFFKQRNIKFYENLFLWSQRRIDLEKYRSSFLQVSIANAPRMTKRSKNTRTVCNELLESHQTPSGGAPSSLFTDIAYTCEGHAGRRGSSLKRGALKIKFPPSGHFCRTGTQWEGTHGRLLQDILRYFVPKVRLNR